MQFNRRSWMWRKPGHALQRERRELARKVMCKRGQNVKSRQKNLCARELSIMFLTAFWGKSNLMYT